MKPTKNFQWIAVAAFLSLSACSTSKVEEADTAPETVSMEPANTDAVPVGDSGPMEFGSDQAPSAPSDAAASSEPSAAPTDPMGAPTDPLAAPSDPAAAPAEPAFASNDPLAAPAEPAGDVPPPPPAEPAALASSDGSAPSDAANTAPAPVMESLDEPTAPPPAPDAIASSDSTYRADEKAPISEDEPAPISDDMASTGSGGATTYRVRKGDTLMKIAFEQYGDLYRWREIFEANRGKVKSPNNLPPGMTLKLSDAGGVVIERNGEKYLIKDGDTLGLISNDVYGTSKKWKSLWENNRQLIKDPNKIYAGFYLYYLPLNRLTGTMDDREPASNGQLEAKAPAEEGLPGQ